MIKDKTFWILLLVCALTLLPFLGLYDYNTKGEPRESIVSYTMLETGNWVLPRNNGGEMAYKPAFFHWCVAAVSAVRGEVTEATSRIPSAVALIAMIMGCFTFFRRRSATHEATAMVTSIILLTCLEIHRAGMNCRVDMVLTALTVGAILMLYRWYEQGMRRVPVIAILLMSCATLTKGPVGSLMPCLCVGCFLLLKRVNFFRAFLSLAGIGLLSFILPAVWYYAAWKQGGQEFLSLMLDENIGRMTGTMTTEVHVNPWWYYLVMLIVGFLPFSIFPLIGLMANGKRLMANGKRLVVNGFQLSTFNFQLSTLTLFSLTCSVVILVFYSIPSCKRSVYIMPMYPFVAYFLARYMLWLADNRKKVINIMGWALSIITLILIVATILLKLHVVPDTIFHGKHAADNIAVLHSLENVHGLFPRFCQCIAAAGSLFYIYVATHSKLPDLRPSLKSPRSRLYLMLIVIVCTYVGIDGAWKPGPLNVKSQKPIAELITRICPERGGHVYEYIEEGVKATGDPVHYFELNYYLHNTIGSFYKERPNRGYLLIGTDDYTLRKSTFQQEGYHFRQLYASTRKVGTQPLLILQFEKVQDKSTAKIN